MLLFFRTWLRTHSIEITASVGRDCKNQSIFLQLLHLLIIMLVCLVCLMLLIRLPFDNLLFWLDLLGDFEGLAILEAFAVREGLITALEVSRMLKTLAVTH